MLPAQVIDNPQERRLEFTPDNNMELSIKDACDNGNGTLTSQKTLRSYNFGQAVANFFDDNKWYLVGSGVLGAMGTVYASVKWGRRIKNFVSQYLNKETGEENNKSSNGSPDSGSPLVGRSPEASSSFMGSSYALTGRNLGTDLEKAASTLAQEGSQADASVARTDSMLPQSGERSNKLPVSKKRKVGPKRQRYEDEELRDMDSSQPATSGLRL